MKSTVYLNKFTKEDLDKLADIDDPAIGDIILKCMHYNAVCTEFCKCKNGGYNIGWMLENGEEFIQTFSEDEILQSLKGKVIDIEITIRDLKEVR